MNSFSRRFTKAILATVFASGVAAGIGDAAWAQSGPAEFPPASFKGSQYVDSKGCVFVRAGINGNVTWVPRMARNRQAVCGFKPSQVAGSTSTPAPVDLSGVTVITAAKPESTAPTTPPRAVAVKRVPRDIPGNLRSARSAAPVTTAPVVNRPVTAVTGPSVRPTASRQPVVRVPAAPVAEARPRVVAPSSAPNVTARVATSCANLSSTGQRYMGFGGGAGVRCGPQADYAPGAPTVGQTAPRLAAAPGYAAPDYRGATGPAYDGSVPRAPAKGGQRATAKVFEVPRTTVQRALPARTTSQTQIAPNARVMPKHVYENKLLSQQGISVPNGYRRVWEDDRLNPRRAEQTLNGKRQMEMVWTQTVPRRLVPVQVVPSQGQDLRRASISSRNAAPKLAKPSAQPGSSYIQVGSFRTPANAQTVAQRLAAKGLPVRLRNSGTAQVVVVGPFANDRDMGNALTIARRAGFHDAFPRR